MTLELHLVVRAGCRVLGALIFGESIRHGRHRDYSERRHSGNRAKDTITGMDEGGQFSRPKTM